MASRFWNKDESSSNSDSSDDSSIESSSEDERKVRGKTNWMDLSDDSGE